MKKSKKQKNSRKLIYSVIIGIFIIVALYFIYMGVYGIPHSKSNQVDIFERGNSGDTSTSHYFYEVDGKQYEFVDKNPLSSQSKIYYLIKHPDHASLSGNFNVEINYIAYSLFTMSGLVIIYMLYRRKK